MQTCLEESVAVADVVALGILNSQKSRLDIGRVGVQIGEMNGGQITTAIEEKFAVVERLLANPIKQLQAIAALVEIGVALAAAARGPAAVLNHDGVSMRVLRLQGGVVDGLRGIRGAHDDDRELTLWLRQLNKGE